MERKNIVLFGQHHRNDLLLQMIAEQCLVDHWFTYQIVKNQGKGYMTRKLDPQLKKATYREAVKQADKIIVLEELPTDAESLMKDKEIVFLQDIQNAAKQVCKTSVAVNLKYGETCFPKVLAKLAEFSRAGYRFQLKTREKDLKSILQILREEGKADLCIWLNPQKEGGFDAELFESIVKESIAPYMEKQKGSRSVLGKRTFTNCKEPGDFW